jgi:hypothetical protein
MIVIRERGTRIDYSFEDLMRYHGGGSPGGVAHAFKVMERAFVLLDDEACPERREIEIRTAFGGPGARDSRYRSAMASSPTSSSTSPAPTRVAPTRSSAWTR